MRSILIVLAAIGLVMTPVSADSPIPPSGTAWGIALNDYSGDGQVDATDFAIWHESLGDFNRDGDVNSEDVQLWRNNFLDSLGQPINRFNGERQPVGQAELTWRGVPLRPMFPSSVEYSGWTAPLVGGFGVAGDYTGDGLVDAADFTVWHQSLADATNNAPAFVFAAGDLNNSGNVDESDYDVWISHFGGSAVFNTPFGTISGDFNVDGTVDLGDYLTWRDALGDPALPSGPTRAGNDWWWAIDLSEPDSCFADQTDDAMLNFDDIDLFVGRYITDNLGADGNGDGSINIDDIDIFVATFLAGCL